ncbi:hypothetical protein [Pontiella agarivorans]|uniref:Uncharacterized protein n=1 Tax=Pontiella agarivorans TaxID=3038953 RepID=A0ABU5MYJ7_9BACT|nr:hypothetical protein [Pontiella agarivorans]MDZ8119272.1 hypothetical protein [Pontiella agarivorans]
MKKIMGMGFVAGVLLIAGCGKKDASVQVLEIEIPDVFVSEPIDGEPTAIPEARKAKAGDKIVLSGLVMGVHHPFVEGRGVFVLGDDGTLEPCDAKGDDHCPTPWDACCDPAELKQAGTVTVQVLGDDGKPIRTGLKGVNGLAELSRVTVSGTVAENSSPAAFIVNAKAIHVAER